MKKLLFTLLVLISITCISQTHHGTNKEVSVTLTTWDDWVCGPKYFAIDASAIGADTAYWVDLTDPVGTTFYSCNPADPTNLHDSVHVTTWGYHQFIAVAEDNIGTLYFSDTLTIKFYKWPEPYVQSNDTACGNCYALEGTLSIDTTVFVWSSLSPSGLTFSSTGSIIGTNLIDTVCVTIIDTSRYINFTEYYPYCNCCAVQTSILIKFAPIPYGQYYLTSSNCTGGIHSIEANIQTYTNYNWTFGEEGEYEIDTFLQNAFGGNYAYDIHYLDGAPWHLVDVVATNQYLCNSSIYRDTVYEVPLNYLDILSLSNPCPGLSNGEVMFAGNGGSSPFMHHELNWLSGMGDVTIYEDSIHVTNLPEGEYLVEITDFYDCVAVDTVFLSDDNHVTITGNVENSGVPLDESEAFVELFHTEYPNGHVIDSCLITTGGFFTLNSIFTGDFYIRASLTAGSIYPEILPTYYSDEFLWQNADTFHLTCQEEMNIILEMKDLFPISTGTGTISGKVYYDFFEKDETNPISNVNIFLTKQSNIDEVYKHTFTNDTGYYLIQEIPSGEYSLLADIPGIPLISFHEFSISSADTLLEDYNFIVDTSGSVKRYGIYASGGNFILENNEGFSISTYPNPTSDFLVIEYKTEKPLQISISIIDGNGKIIIQQNGENNSTDIQKLKLDVFSDLPSGIYYLTFRYDNNVFIKKIVKEK
ncbi:MAG: hypothetical protein A2W91_04965 [Bacteroidetes bacterium GWF2_38_335]|nr:MAG: hypothetical protein A2W91_04965 [Bacteroidetes bacterium GWF2_38_335]OFY79818.1 MAG: hypothetical protein A2281_10455 [Bacteroidetes bacterium RIFOXYA12_FULL_38_20]